jgi:hypothetical protein
MRLIRGIVALASWSTPRFARRAPLPFLLNFYNNILLCDRI